jgi:predicted acetyltransferase
MTCNDDNVASIRIIEKHGGALENRVDHDGVLLRRYWIDND